MPDFPGALPIGIQLPPKDQPILLVSGSRHPYVGAQVVGDRPDPARTESDPGSVRDCVDD